MQVFEVGTATMMAAKGAIKPVYQLMADAGETFDPNAYLPAVTGYYSTADGKMLSLPFNSSTPVVYWNKEAFKKAGLDPDKPPKTWPETFDVGEEAARRRGAVRLYRVLGQLDPDREFQRLAQPRRWRPRRTGSKAPMRCSNSTTRPSPAHRQPGRGAEGQELRLRRAHHRARGQIHLRRLRHDPEFLGLLRRGQGRREIRLRHDRAALLPGCHGGAAEHDHRRRQPVGDGRQEARGIQGHRQVLHLSVGAPKCSEDWHEATGYLPITKAAYEATKASGFYDKNPGREVPIIQMTGKPPTENSRGLRLGNLVQIRDVIAEDLEAAFAGKTGRAKPRSTTPSRAATRCCGSSRRTPSSSPYSARRITQLDRQPPVTCSGRGSRLRARC